MSQATIVDWSYYPIEDKSGVGRGYLSTRHIENYFMLFTHSKTGLQRSFICYFSGFIGKVSIRLLARSASWQHSYRLMNLKRCMQGFYPLLSSFIPTSHERKLKLEERE